MHANIQTSANECKEGGGGGGGYEESCRDVCVAAEQDTPSHWRLLTETRSECSFVSFCGGHAHQDHKYHPSCWTHPLSPIRLEAFLKSHQIYKHQISSFMTPKSPHICNGISNTRHREMTHAEAWQAVSVQSKHDWFSRLPGESVQSIRDSVRHLNTWWICTLAWLSYSWNATRIEVKLHRNGKWLFKIVLGDTTFLRFDLITFSLKHQSTKRLLVISYLHFFFSKADYFSF